MAEGAKYVGSPPEVNVGTFTDETVEDLPRFYLIEAVRQ